MSKNREERLKKAIDARKHNIGPLYAPYANHGVEEALNKTIADMEYELSLWVRIRDETM